MSTLIDLDSILSENEQWLKLEEEWIPVDLETEDDFAPNLLPVFSTLDLKLSTFDSSFLFKKVRRKIGRKLSKKSTISGLEYKDFIQDLQKNPTKESSKQFYYINGQIISAISVEEICGQIDNIFKSIEKLATSTVRKKNQKLPDVVNCSISSSDLSFDDTVIDISEKEKTNSAIDRCIEEAFEHINSTQRLEGVDQSMVESVTTLVRKFSCVRNNQINCSPRRQRQCSSKFKDLADFWNHRAFECD